MPKDNIEKAIKRGTGEIEGVSYDELLYEGYGPNGVAMLVEVMTDNKNRTVAEVRHIFAKYGGNLAETGAVSWNFEQKGSILIPRGELDEDEFMMQALEAGAEDVLLDDDEFFEVITSLNDFHTVSTTLEGDFTIEKAELTRIPKNTIKADDFAERIFKLVEKMEDLDDVQQVYTNSEVSDEVMERIANQ